ncbi:alpha/beta fold hydrolase [Streptomyces sp. NBC_01314]|uniref:alpha/beta fold hydrolase n=1 Tax=Streptomyces sp. NBC_01314 TaxID=2903821 RepID=UPI0030884D35|nr:alpha/beta hydrolase [Streptomyces sp. NBC_01314]
MSHRSNRSFPPSAAGRSAGPDEVDFLVAELEHTGLAGPLNYYRTLDLNREVLGEYESRPVTVPALFIGGDRDVTTIWSREAIARIAENVHDLRGSVILADCGHWIGRSGPRRSTESCWTSSTASGAGPGGL